MQRMGLGLRKPRLLTWSRLCLALIICACASYGMALEVHLEWDASVDLEPLHYRMAYNSPMHDHLLLPQTGERLYENVWQENAAVRYTAIDMGVVDSVILYPFCQPGYGCLKGYAIYYGESSGDYSGTGLDQGDSPVYAGCSIGFTLTGLDPVTTYYLAATAYRNSGYDNLQESYYSNEVSFMSSYTCGNGVCDTGECIAGCTDDCSVEDCCGIEGCNVAIGETVENCPGDCSNDPPPCESGTPNFSGVSSSGYGID
jgi:hypothetical protein